ncbi:APC family permease [Legionella israelensis]|uniref:APC family permease n=1 Tax=Legionella israelensis TaxID=454 RepID=UPI001FD433CB|nr:amino acid permease [Legionella israelensis]
MNNNKNFSIPLKRTLSKLAVIFYGLGTILGAGIYVLVGKVAGHAGNFAPLAFLLASFIALFSVISYAELSSRFPKSAGEAFYIQKAFENNWLSALVGWLVVFTGLVSAAVLARGFAGYLQLFVTLPVWLAMVLLVLFLGTVAIWGIKESAILIMLITLIEAGGLLFIIFLPGHELLKASNLWQAFTPASIQEWSGIFSGAFIAFYAYVGFEDMVNVAEEIKSPEKNLPPAMFWALALATLLYLLVALAIISTLSIEELTQSDAPLASFIEKKGYSPILIGLIGLIAVINGALVQMIMASRVLYGMAKQQNAPRALGWVNSFTQTPVLATVVVMLMVLVFALWFDVEDLAKITSSIMLCVFIMIHLSLIKMKLRKTLPENEVVYSIFFPVTGAILSSFFLISQLWS